MFGDEIIRDDEKDDTGGEKRDELDAEFIHEKKEVRFRASSTD